MSLLPLSTQPKSTPKGPEKSGEVHVDPTAPEVASITCANKLGALGNKLPFATCSLAPCPPSVEGSLECLILNGALLFYVYWIRLKKTNQTLDIRDIGH